MTGITSNDWDDWGSRESLGMTRMTRDDLGCLELTGTTRDD